MKPLRKNVEKQKKLCAKNLEAYQGKLALLQTYDQMAIRNEDTHKLCERVHGLMNRLRYRGAM